jgi:hypothetical protein
MNLYSISTRDRTTSNNQLTSNGMRHAAKHTGWMTTQTLFLAFYTLAVDFIDNGPGRKPFTV